MVVAWGLMSERNPPLFLYTKTEENDAMNLDALLKLLQVLVNLDLVRSTI